MLKECYYKDKNTNACVFGGWWMCERAHACVYDDQVEYSEKGSSEWFSQRSTSTSTEVKRLQPSALYRFRVRPDSDFK